MTTFYLADAQSEAGYVPSVRGDIEAGYRRALRHSRRVRWLRVAVLIGIAVVLLAVVVDNYLPLGGFRLPGDMGKMVIKGTKITMQQPHLRGFTADSRAYEFTADAAAQDITKPDLVELQQIRAQVEMEDKSTVKMWADAGIYDLKADMLTLSSNIHLVSSTGYEGRLSQARVDMRKGNVVSDKPVWLKLLNGDLNAKGMEIVNNGELIRFSKVTLVLQPEKQEANAGEP